MVRVSELKVKENSRFQLGFSGGDRTLWLAETDKESRITEVYC
jgi:hypothetical protein